MNKRHLILILKLLFSGAIFYWLIKSDRLDFSLLENVLKSPKLVFYALLLEALIFIIVSYRYSIIIKIKSRKIELDSIFKFNWIAQFFNTILPGSVTGDLIKIFYLHKEDKELSKSFLLASIFIDRAIGLLGLIIGLGFFSLLNYKHLSSISESIKTILNVNLTIAGSAMFFLLLLFKIKKIPSVLTRSFKRLSNLVTRLIEFKKDLFSLIALSILSQILAVILFWVLTSPFSNGYLSLSFAFSIVPIGFLVLAIPIAPSGMGIGHAAFHALFLFAGITNGASLFNIYFLIIVLTNLTGIIPYLLLKRSD